MGEVTQRTDEDLLRSARDFASGVMVGLNAERNSIEWGMPRAEVVVSSWVGWATEPFAVEDFGEDEQEYLSRILRAVETALRELETEQEGGDA